jgi:hypothetical protein
MMKVIKGRNLLKKLDMAHSLSSHPAELSYFLFLPEPDVPSLIKMNSWFQSIHCSLPMGLVVPQMIFTSGKIYCLCIITRTVAASFIATQSPFF